jgi:hypothetical protein
MIHSIMKHSLIAPSIFEKIKNKMSRNLIDRIFRSNESNVSGKRSIDYLKPLMIRKLGSIPFQESF